MGWLILAAVIIFAAWKLIWWLRVQAWLISLKKPKDIMEAHLLISQHRRMRKRK